MPKQTGSSSHCGWSAIFFIPPACESYGRLVKLFIASAKRAIPRGYRKEYIPCWTEESERLYAEIQETEDPDTAKELLKSLDEARRSKWCQTVESLDFARSSIQAWSLLRRLGGASQLPGARSSIRPDLIARRIVNSSKAPADKPFTRKILRDYHQLRKYTLDDTELSCPFTAEEVETAAN